MYKIEVRNLRKGMKVIEVGYGSSVEMSITEDAEWFDEGWQSVGLKEDGTEVYLYVAKGAECYGPKLYLMENE